MDVTTGYYAFFKQIDPSELRPKDRVRVHRPSGAVVTVGFVVDAIGRPGHLAVRVLRDDNLDVSYAQPFYQFQRLHEGRNHH